MMSLIGRSPCGHVQAVILNESGAGEAPSMGQLAVERMPRKMAELLAIGCPDHGYCARRRGIRLVDVDDEE